MTNPKPLSLKLSWSTCNKCCGKMMDRGISKLCHTAILKPSGKLSWTSTAALLSWLCKVLGSTHSPAKQTPQKTTVAVPEVCLAKTTLSALFTTPWPSVWETRPKRFTCECLCCSFHLQYSPVPHTQRVTSRVKADFRFKHPGIETDHVSTHSWQGSFLITPQVLQIDLNNYLRG